MSRGSRFESVQLLVRMHIHSCVFHWLTRFGTLPTLTVIPGKLCKFSNLRLLLTLKLLYFGWICCKRSARFWTNGVNNNI